MTPWAHDSAGDVRAGVQRAFITGNSVVWSVCNEGFSGNLFHGCKTVEKPAAHLPGLYTRWKKP